MLVTYMIAGLENPEQVGAGPPEFSGAMDCVVVQQEGSSVGPLSGTSEVNFTGDGPI